MKHRMATLLAKHPLLSSGFVRRPAHALAWARYVALHEAIRLPLLGLHRLTFAMAGQRSAPNKALVRDVRRRYRQLLAQDFENARRGLYPMQLLFDMPLRAYAHRLPRLLFDVPSVLGRIKARDYRDLPASVNLDAYPAYYRRNFHWQTDGYLSRHSAEIYDLGVELLFIGCADVMRRQTLAEVVRRKPRGPVRLLDVGAGTGRFLGQAASSLPGSELTGVELSPWYQSFAETSAINREANQRVRIEVANAEALPFEDRSFDVVTSIFLLHELPRRVRRKVLSEMWRVLTPGGLCVLQDAAQPSDSAEIEPALHQFSKDLHEPFFVDYLKDDLKALLEGSGFRVQHVAPHFVSKVVSAAKILAD
jgi:ubiquinone/menaquinone biosynthesis C-methylase UbiE